MKIIFTCIVVASLIPASTSADYRATGSFEGAVCNGVVFETCTIKTFVAVEKDGQLYRINATYPDVDDYQKRDEGGRCWITTDPRRTGFMSLLGDVGSLIGSYTRPVFVTPQGEREKPDYLTFKCIKSSSYDK